MKNLFGLLFVAVLFTLTSCGDVDCDDASAIAAIGTKIETTSTAYNADPSEDNCKDFKGALEESLDYSDCDGSTQEAIDITNALIESLDC